MVDQGCAKRQRLGVADSDKLAPMARVDIDRRRYLALGGIVIVLAIVAAWLLLETRARPTVERAPAPRSTPTAADVGGGPRPSTSSVSGTSPADASGTGAHQSIAERDAAKAERTHWVQRAISSHLVTEKWTASGQALIDRVGQRAAHVQDAGCYVIGCTATFTFASRTAYDDAYRDVTASAEYLTWHSGKRWTLPEEQDDGRIIVALVLYRID